MVALIVVLYVAGFVIPAGAAVVAYRRTTRIAPRVPDDRPTYDDVNRWVNQDIPNLFRDRMSAVKWPAIWALVGLLCGTVASLLSLTLP